MKTEIFEGAHVLITGASSGIGEAFAHDLAKKGCHLILTARSEDKLTQTANELTTKYGLSVHVFPADLTSAGEPQKLIERIKGSGLPIDILVNNAGFGKWAHFLSEDLATYAQMLRLNIDALVTLTYLCLPDMLARKKGGVINVASTAAFQPLPYQAVYGASKTFVLNFTEALAGEYRDSGVRFLALCPGFTATNFMATANADTTGMPFATPQAVAQAGLAAFVKGRSHLVHGRMNALTALLPRWLTRAATVKIVVGMFEKKMGPRPA